MNEMDLLTRFREEIPVGDPARAEEIFRTARDKDISAKRPVVPGLRNRFAGLQPAWRFAIIAPLVAALAAGAVVAGLPSGTPAQQPLTVKLLADRAAAAALATPAVPARQWVYQQTENYFAGRRAAGLPNPSVQDGWMTADGRITYGAGSVGDAIVPYNQLGSLPSDPAALNAYFVSRDPVKTDNKSIVAFSPIMELLFSVVLPPSLQAEMYHALALIPTVQVRQNVKDIAGRAGVAFVLPPTGQSEKLEIILDASDYHLLARANWSDPSQRSPSHETAILKQVLVAELGSTQPSTAPPSAAEVAAEQIAYNQQWHYKPPNNAFVTPSQWLYRDLRTGGKDRQIWATVDDSKQAEYVGGALQVCQRTDPCAASQQWLMPAGPSYSLVNPPYPRPSLKQIKRVNDSNFPKSAKSVKPPKPLPTLPSYPRPLLDKLNSYSTGCTDIADACNAVNVAANMLTGYGNVPSPDILFLALADVPGVTVQNVTDAAGHADVAFRFPFTNGITGILLDASTYQFAGYERGSTQVLLTKVAAVSGPGVRP